MTAIVDYKAGNLTSVKNAFAAIGAEAVVTRDASVVERADRVVFPGVGAAASAMSNLRAMGLAAKPPRRSRFSAYASACRFSSRAPRRMAASDCSA